MTAAIMYQCSFEMTLSLYWFICRNVPHEFQPILLWRRR